MTFRERYQLEETWYGKIQVMEIYHLAMSHRIISSRSSRVKPRKWTVGNTAKYFHTSIGLTSENLRLAYAMHKNHDLLDCASRHEALKSLKRWVSGSNVEAQRQCNA